MNTLEIIIPTFNRARFLGQTLDALAASPFWACRITILDNSSTDNTKHTVKRCADSLPNLVYRRNGTNIGAERNYCLAVEISIGPYVWILGDDDSYSWQYGMPVCEKMIDAILGQEFDLILPGVTFDNLKVTGAHSLADLVAKRVPIFFPLAFAPGLIFKRAYYTAEILKQAKALADAGNLLPMMPFLDAMASKRSTVFISELRHVTKGMRHGYSSLRAMLDWLELSRSIQQGKAMFDEMFEWPQFGKNVLASLLCDPRDGSFNRLLALASHCPSAHLFWPVALLPDVVKQLFRNFLSLSEYDGNRTELPDKQANRTFSVKPNPCLQTIA
jgi:hypothetical protein